VVIIYFWLGFLVGIQAMIRTVMKQLST